MNYLNEKYRDQDYIFYNYSILFYKMNAYDFSLLCLDKCPSNGNTNWLKADLLFLSKRFFECIDLCNAIFLASTEDPDMQFASLYQKAQALKEIGSLDEAKEIMNSILKLRPNYRSAYEILQTWKESH